MHDNWKKLGAHLDAEEKNAYLNLLEESYPGFKSHILRCEALGFPWESRPFLKKKEGQLLSHVGFLEYPMLIEGRWYKIGALHAICSRKSHRSQGLASALIQEVLDWAKKEYDFVVLFTEIPEFYERLAFQRIPEHRFYLKCLKPKGAQPLIPLSTPKDNPLFWRCFQHRTPNSHHLSVKDHGTISAYNALFATYPDFWSLHYSPEMDAILSFTIEDKTLHLFDIVADKMPALDRILDHIPAEIEGVYFYFSPDLLTDKAIIEPLVYDNNLADFSGYLMAHGNWPEVKPFMISLLSRC